MKNIIKPGKATISLVLVVLMALLLPVQVFAQTLPESEDTEIVSFNSLNEAEDSANIVAELTGLRDEYTKQFRMDDGTIMAVTYDCPVHYKNSKGKWIEYDNSLVAENEATVDEAVPKSYKNKKSDTNIEVSSNTDTENLVNISSPKGNISWKYVGARKSTAKIKNNNKKHNGNEKFTSIDKLSSQVNYNNVYDNIDINCIVSSTGVKENIILNNSDAQNEFVIDYNIKGLKAKQTGEKSIELYKGKKLVYTITAPYMYDADGNISDNLTLNIAENKGNRLSVKLVADKGFLNSFGRAYPVTIDPEVTISGSINTETAQVRENQPDTTYSNTSYFYVGESLVNNYSGFYSGVVKYKNLQENYGDKNIVSAKVNIFPLGEATEMEIEAYPVTCSWNYQTATYNNVTHGSEVIDYAKTKSGSSDAVSFDVTKYAKNGQRAVWKITESI